MRHWKAPSQKQSWRCRSAQVAWRNATVYACTTGIQLRYVGKSQSCMVARKHVREDSGTHVHTEKKPDSPRDCKA